MYQSHFPAVRNNPERHFFDNAATTQYCQVAIDTIQQLNNQPRANISRGIYHEAEKMSEAYEQARNSIAKLIGAKSNEIIFCSGTTNAINIAAQSLINNLQQDQAILISDVEHHSNFLPWVELCKQKNITLYRLPLNKNGSIDFSQLQKFDNKNIAVVSITHCSNVTGVVSDIPLVSQWCKKNNAKLMLDGAQTMQHGIPNMNKLDTDVYCFSGHKIFASSGIGVLYAKEELLNSWEPTQWGGGMVLNISSSEKDAQTLQYNNIWLQAPQKFEAGTPPYQQAIALAKTLEWFAQLKQKNLTQHHQKLFDRTEHILQKYDFIQYIDNANEIRNPIFAFNIKGLHPHDAAQLFDNQGFCVRAGHHCAKPLMQYLQINACLRISLSCYNTLEELELFEGALENIYQQSQHFHTSI